MATSALVAVLAACTSSATAPKSGSDSLRPKGTGLATSAELNHRILYQWGESSDRIWVTDADARDGRALLANAPGINDYHPDWSPDGARVVFMAEYLSHAGADYAHSDIWVADSDGANARLLFESPEDMPWSEYPAWSPDERSVLIVSWNNERNVEVSTRSALVQIDVATGKGAEIASLSGNHEMLSEPRWSPDGSAIVCTIGRFNADDTKFTGEALAVLHREGSRWSKPTPITAFASFGGYPDWGGDSDRIVFATGDSGAFSDIVDNSDGRITRDVQPMRDLYTVRPDGSDRRKVTAGTSATGFAGQPTWMPDGRIIFTRWPGTPGDLPSAAVIRPDGTGLAILHLTASHPRVPRNR